jgi:hypothetical protein
MKLADIGDLTTFRSSGRMRKVGAWSYYDDTVGWDTSAIRSVYHYGTKMGHFQNDHNDWHLDSWYFVPVSTGWGSASDQQGMNKILKNFGWCYRRNGGNPRYEKR